MGSERMQIGEVADRVGLSLRTIRFYEESDLVTPSARTAGGFRLYSQSDVDRLILVKAMKPLGFSVDEIGELLGVLDRLDEPDLPAADRTVLMDRLDVVRADVDERIESLVAKVEQSHDFARRLTQLATRSSDAPDPS